MKQVKLHPSGAQSWYRRTVTASEHNFAFASTLAVYVYRLEDFTMQALLTGHDRTITCIEWSPHSRNVLCTASVDGTLVLWNTLTGERRIRRSLRGAREHGLKLDWHPHFPGRVGVGCSPSNTFNIWDFELGAKESTDSGFLQVVECTDSIAAMQWNPQDRGMVVMGHALGTLTLITDAAAKTRTVVKVKSLVGGGSGASSKVEIADLRWDTLTSVYLLVAYKSGALFLWDR